MQIPIDEILLEHEEVKQKVVGRNIVRLLQGKEFDPISVLYCHHLEKYLLSDGHHRLAAYYCLKKRTIEGEIESCTNYECKGDWHKLTTKEFRFIK